MESKALYTGTNNELTRYIDRLEEAQQAWFAAGQRWENEQTEEAGQALEKAVSNYHEVSADFAEWMAAAYRTGWRLRLLEYSS